MKMKLLLFMGLIAGSISLSLLFGATTYAAGENYKWINDTTIEATGGAYDSKIMTTKQFGSGGGTAVPIKKVTFVRDGNTNVFKATGSQPYYSTGANGTLGATKCDLQLSITATTLSAATLAVNNPIGTPCPDSTLTTTLAIGATDAGPDEKSITDAAAAAANPANPAPGEAAKVSTCKIDAIGWLLCPVMDFMSKVIDGAYAFVASLMVVKPITTDSSDAAKSMYAAWSIMRNFANVAFVIAFMMIIFSQMTSVGLNNYGIKRMLPRLIVAAILVNASYWICAIAVDLSNILGASLNGLFTSAIPVLGANDRAAFVLAGDTSGGGWQGLVSAVLIGGAATAVLYATLSALVPALLAALLAILTVFIVLTMRQALIILLVVVSPLAFVAYLLPNTESLFKKWLGLFKTLLLMYPIIAMIFGASALASSVVMTSASGSKYAIAIQIMGALISIVPLALTPIIMKTAGGVLSKVGAFVNNPNKGPVDRLRKGIGGWQKNQKVNRQLRAMDPEKFSMPGRRAAMNFGNKRRAINSGRADQLEQMQKEQIAKLATAEDGNFARQVAGNSDGRAELYAAKQASYLASIDPDKIKLDVDKSQIDNMVGTLKLSVKDPANTVSEITKVFDEAVASGDAIKARAAQEILRGTGSPGKEALRNSLMKVDSRSAVGTELRKDIANSDMKNSSADMYKWSVDDQHRSIEEISKDASTYSNLSEAQAAGQIKSSLEAAIKVNGITANTAASVIASRAAEGMGKAEKDLLRKHAESATISFNPQGTPGQPGTLNIPHGANPGNSRTPPANVGGPIGSNGLIVPGSNRNNNNQP